MHSGEIMVVTIVAMVLAARVYRDGCAARGRNAWGRWGVRRERERWDAPRAAADDDAETLRLREEVRALRERIAVLERIATDSSTHLDREIEALRDRPYDRAGPETRERPYDRPAPSREPL